MYEMWWQWGQGVEGSNPFIPTSKKSQKKGRLGNNP